MFYTTQPPQMHKAYTIGQLGCSLLPRHTKPACQLQNASTHHNPNLIIHLTAAITAHTYANTNRYPSTQPQPQPQPQLRLVLPPPNLRFKQLQLSTKMGCMSSSPSGSGPNDAADATAVKSGYTPTAGAPDSHAGHGYTGAHVYHGGGGYYGGDGGGGGGGDGGGGGGGC
jgi:hypothetical protein